MLKHPACGPSPPSSGRSGREEVAWFHTWRPWLYLVEMLYIAMNPFWGFWHTLLLLYDIHNIMTMLHYITAYNTVHHVKHYHTFIYIAISYVNLSGVLCHAHYQMHFLLCLFSAEVWLLKLKLFRDTREHRDKKTYFLFCKS